ncbi:hypothetical protein J2Z62_000779 [Mycoplasmoides fastidiosum]|uniref:Lipoprotein n=1 Tax=Mycoplasmoides fastidiosum TaxID=92758 RepID=A0ABU0M062_9BACT|nr:DUF3713 domain-containing protein [Mycoplasmoides fastidiosum]MDQ0514341.1 hypothetical protein [Mycoplasmoides fastidiosum]UUD38057.1 hypothetical protein NPA10_01530 [Mycoplasmoides fastidiosum]
MNLLKKIALKNQIRKIRWLSILGTSAVILSACAKTSSDAINDQYNNTPALATNFHLTNLQQNNLVSTILNSDLIFAQTKLNEAVANRLKFQWAQDFIADKTVDKGSELFKTQEAIEAIVKQGQTSYDESLNSFSSSGDSDWQKLFQRQLNPFGGTKEGWKIHHVGPELNDRLVEAIFQKLFFSYQRKTSNGEVFFTNNALENEINNPSFYSNFVFTPSNDDLRIGNEKYQKMFANFQAFVFNYWFDQERPFIGWNVEWKYGTSVINSLANIYNTNRLGENDVTLPTEPNYNFPSFDIGDNSTSVGTLATFNRWQTGVKGNSLINTQNGDINLQSVFNDGTNTSPELTSWKIYTKNDLARTEDGYLSSALAHQYNKLFTGTNGLVNEIDLSNSNAWTDEQMGDPLNVFLDQVTDTKSTIINGTTPVKAGIKVNNAVLFNQNNTKFKDKNFSYPLRDIKTTSSSKTLSNWTLARTKTGISALAVDGTTRINEATSLADKLARIKENILWRQALFSLNPRRNNRVINIDLLKVLKDYAKANFNDLIVAYARALQTPETLKKLTNDTYFFTAEQNFLLNNNQQLFDLTIALEDLKRTVNNQRTLVNFRNSLAQTVSGLANKQFVKVNDKYYAPYANGLATPLGFKRNLNTTTDDPVFNPGSTADTTTFSNNGDYPEVTKFFSSDQINNQVADFKLNQILTKTNDAKTKMDAWVQTLTNSNDNLISNKDLFHLNSLEFNYLFQALLTTGPTGAGDGVGNYLKGAYLANEINFDYRKNSIDYNFGRTSLTTDFGKSATDLKKSVLDAVAEVFYSEVYLGVAQNINNGRDFIGGYKIDTSNSTSNVTSYTNKLISYWNQILYSFSNLGQSLGDQFMSRYVTFLYTLDWLLKDNYTNLLNYLQNQIGFNSYGAIVWAQEHTLNQAPNTGEATVTNNNTHLKSFDQDFKFVPNPNNVLSSPYFSYELAAPTSVTTNNSLFNYVGAEAITTDKYTSDNTGQKKRLSGFYGLALQNESLPNAIPEVVKNSIFTNFAESNPDGNKSIFDLGSTQQVLSRGKLFGSAILNDSAEFDLQKTLDYILDSVRNVKTFRAFNTVGQELANLFPKITASINSVISQNSVNQLEPAKGEDETVIPNQFVASQTLPPLRINLKQKIQAMINVLNGMEYNLDQTNNDTLKSSFDAIYNQEFKPNESFALFNKNDLERFIGVLQNPQAASSIFPNLKYFIPTEVNARTGYVAYIVQINNEDVSNVDKFRAFIKQIGFDAFLKTVVNLAKVDRIQGLAFDNFTIRPEFEKLVVRDERLVNLLGLNWASLYRSETEQK